MIINLFSERVIIIITIAGKPIDLKVIIDSFPIDSMETKIVTSLYESQTIYRYASFDQLKFEINLRANIVRTAVELSKSGFKFRTFKDSMCNPEFWERTEQGGFLLKKNVSPYDAISDIYANSSKYGTECSTAIVIIYYGALLRMYPKGLFDSVFPDLYLYSWQNIDSDLGISTKESPSTQTPGDCRYFKNPDFDPKTPEWRGENVIDLGNGTYYGHDIGIKTAEGMISALNKHRKDATSETAYLTNSVTNPDYKHLSNLYYNYQL